MVLLLRVRPCADHNSQLHQDSTGSGNNCNCNQVVFIKAIILQLI